ncbi:eugenol synthase 1-like isoform X1 [Vigna unguiculata]|uniref:eugenol synthase 1-like isoform X1 n=1 Tax=Vigna unguiculata TaxID=3917 RepID=UPI0010167BFF|nr:eugenol synthase 1-like isoform X1 [Vigna unguiculata]XP_027920974.1 eugenol synthase 1-like isoform X1 [Vigna unguiculata]
MERKNRIVVFGGTGYIGKHLVKASLSLGHPTFVYTRPLTSQTPPSKIQLCKDFTSMGVTLLQGELKYEEIVEAIKKADIVISALAYPQVMDQLKIIEAIKVVGNIKRFVPSGFGAEEDRIKPLPPFQVLLEKKMKIRREIEAAGIPYTSVSANCCAAYFVNYLLRPYEDVKDIVVYGNGEAKAVLNYEEDIAMYTVKAANDPRTRNRVVIYRPPKNIISQNELISLWEKKCGHTFTNTFILEEELVKQSQTLPPPQSIPVSILHSVFVRGDMMKFEIGEDDLEASELYPDYNYTSIDELLDIFLLHPLPPASAAFG